MREMKKRIETMFEVWTRTIIRFRFPVLLLVLIPTFFIGSQVRNLTMDTSNEGLLHPEDPILTVYNAFWDQFGRDDLLVLAIKSDNIFMRTVLSSGSSLNTTTAIMLP